MRVWLRRLVRGLLSRYGYVLWKREYFRYGISPFVDISRINRTWGRSVDVLFDVGANVGQFALEALTELPNARVFCFEPHPQSFARLERAVSDDRAALHQLALGQDSGEVTLYEYGASGEGSLINSLVPDARFPVRFGYEPSQLRVECTTVDAFCESDRIGKIDVLKIDTEGFDLQVLRGAENMLLHGRIAFVYVEFNDLEVMPGTTGGALVPIADYLTKFGLRYVCTYTDFVLHGAQLHVCANALFALPAEPG